MSQPLSGTVVIDASRVLAGPLCGQILGDHGADVIKVEAPSGDECRSFGPPVDNGSAAYFNAVNRNKRSVVLDLQTETDRATFEQLLARADVLIENFKASTLRSWGYSDPSEITRRYPRLVHCRVTGFGDDGPLGGLPGYDAAVQAIAGLMSVNGEPDGPPVRLGSPIVDLTTGMNAAMAVVLALQERHRSGKGQMADIALYDSAVSMAHPYLANHVATGAPTRRFGNGHPDIVPYNVFETATVPLFIAVANNRQFAHLCDLLGHPELAEQPEFATNPGRVAHREALEVELRPRLKAIDGTELGEAMLARGVPCAPIHSVDTVAAAPHTAHRNMVVRTDDYTGPGIPISFSRTPPSIRRGAPRLGADQAEILAELSPD
ncbi:Crotonobetainyl-CoA:carnitine CoA-transferase CaiB [Pseudonocardia ammonioxydans]|uniref:Crotonobetainyl-CoA:carnitine CoA-transferase CaiB n=1 Tax=Pseudonocardia ammonioxydans TaxID=260086 RepID=A0A1I5HM34_PSUAM|nr:CoA transferase [Pseudonocardia ammonioxydans]SFO49378.1 Crotonobetainyl-CoA:carnitine CoA-transferase CaiB [Pseudonocardia ammonioxydans]